MTKPLRFAALLGAVALAAIPATAAAQPARKKSPAVAAENWTAAARKAMGYMIQGGIFMWPILFLGILALGVIIERFRALMMLNTRAEGLRNRVRELLEQ